MKKIHDEFAFQSRELHAQIEDTLGEPPDRKYYARVIKSLIGEYAKGAQIDDVNMLSFALVDYLRFDNPAGLFAQCKDYDQGDASKMLELVSCADEEANTALITVYNQNPELARKAILTAFLYKNRKRWAEQEVPEETQQEEDDGDVDENEEDPYTVGHEFEQLFDPRGD
jgi:hypothetical protein